jgi:hypothetical protein
MTPVGSRKAVAAVAALVAVAWPAAAGACTAPPKALLASLRHGLKPSAHAQLRTVDAVRGRGRFKSVFAKGVWFVSGDVGGRIATWAVSPDAFRTGHGAIFALDRTARTVSSFGVLVSPALIATWGVSTHTPGYAESRACAAG